MAKFHVRVPDAAELAKYEDLAGLSHDNPERMAAQSRAASQGGHGGKGGGAGSGAVKAMADFETISEQNPTSTASGDKSFTPVSYYKKQELVPKIHRLLGQAGHRKIYADEMTKFGGTPESRGAEWDKLSDEDKYRWQQGQGKAPTASAIATAKADYRQTQNAKDKAAFDLRDTVKSALFTKPEDRENFEQTGALTTGKEIHYMSNPRDPRQRDVQGELSTQPEYDWRKAWQAPLTARPEAGSIAPNADSSHFETMGSHINQIENTPTNNKKQLPIFAKGTDSNHMVGTWYNQYGHLNAAGQTLQANQFDVKGRELMGAKSALAKAAKAHSMGMAGAAFEHYRTAGEHLKNAIDAHYAKLDPSGTMSAEASSEERRRVRGNVSAYRSSIGQ